MNPTNINQLLWSNILTSSTAEGLSQLITATISEHKDSDVVDMLDVVLNTTLSAEKYNAIIPIIEGLYIKGSTIDLAPYLSVLYHQVGKDYLSKYYFGLIENPTEKAIEIIRPVASVFEHNETVECSACSLTNYNFKRDYCYNGERKQYSVHSFSTTIGKNATVLKTPYGAIMFDCGASCSVNDTEIISEIELLEFFQSIDISPDDLVAVIISHAHLDHYGSIATLFNLGIDSSKIFIEHETKSLIQQVAVDLPSIDQVFSVDAFFVPFQKIKISAFPNGHIIGSTGYVVTFDEINVVYTGDYCLHSQKTVAGLNLDKLLHHKYISKYGVDCIITETTYGKRAAIIEYEDVAKIFVHFVDLLISNGYKVFIPSFAIGRSQEIALLLNQTHSVLIDGLAAKISKIYEDVAGVDIFNSKTRYNENFDSNKEENFDCNDIIIASSGMLTQNSTSYNYVKEFLASPRKIAIIKTVYISSESYGHALLNEWKGQNDRLFDISLSAHADFNEICELIVSLNPRHIVCVHGDGLNSSLICSGVEDVLVDQPSKTDGDSGIDSTTNGVTPSNEITADTFVAGDNEGDLDDDIATDIVDERKEFVPKHEKAVVDELRSANDEAIINLIQQFLDHYANTSQTDRASTCNPNERNRELNDSYYELYSYVRFDRRFPVLYEALYIKGRKKRSRIVKFLARVLDKLQNRSADEELEISLEVEPKQPEWTPSSVLYVHKGTIKCQRDSHNVVPATAVFIGRNECDIQLSVNYCYDCNRFFINYVSYEAYRNKYGFLIGNIVLEDDSKFSFGDTVLSEESPLKLCGYSVNQQDGYSRETRQYIIAKIISRGIMTKSDVIRYLEYFISMNGKRRGNEVAVMKWKQDLEFALAYNFEDQDKYIITEVRRY